MNYHYVELRKSIPFRFITYPLGCMIKYFERKNFRNSEWPAKIRKYKNIHQGEACYIIGNGPSLTPEDLDLIEGKYSFASNAIFNIFDKTNWRPTYYCCEDFAVLNNLFDEINLLKCKQKFISNWARKNGYKFRDCIYMLSQPFYIINIYNYKRSYIKEEISDYLNTGFTISYSMIQLAIYMGFKKIYLLGMDFSMPFYKDKYGFTHYSGDVKAHFDGGDSINKPILNKYSYKYAFENARKYCDTHGIVIRNATRGGKLDVIDRIALEETI